jgi:zinc transport system substrate-binding protein
MSGKKLISSGLAVGLVLSVVLCASVFAGKEKLKVSVSILPQAYFVERIGGDRVEIRVVMPKYSDHDTYQPTPKQLSNIYHSDLYIKIGMPHFAFEQKHVDPVVRKGKGLAVVDMAKGIPLLPDDPHIWISPHTVRPSVLNIYEALCKRDPARSALYEKNLKIFLKEIDSLEAEIAERLAPWKGGSFMIFHPALGYLAERYGLKQLVIESEGKSPSALRLKKLSDEALKKQIKTILVQKGFDHKSAKAVASEIGARLVEIDPLEKDWVRNIRHITDTLTQALVK